MIKLYRLMKKTIVLLALVISTSPLLTAQWNTVECNGSCTARSENGFVAHQGALYLIGGRGIKPIEKYSIQNNTWSELMTPPLEMHHITPVSVSEKIYVVGGLTGQYPTEQPLSHVYAYSPANDTWEELMEIPENRRRGGAGVTVYKGKIYLINGIINGHTSGTSNMFDVYDPSNNTWQELPDAPNIRDHSGAAVVNDLLIAIGGRNTSYHEPDNFTAFFRKVISEVDYYDFTTGSWSTFLNPLPAPSAGAGVVELNKKVYYIGGETAEIKAFDKVYSFDPLAGSWLKKPFLVRGRHGTNAVVHNDAIYIAAGCGNRGGSPELNSIEMYRE